MSFARAILLTALLAAGARAEPPVLDFVIPLRQIGDNVILILHFPYLALAQKYCKRQGYALRVWAPEPMASALRRSAPANVQVQELKMARPADSNNLEVLAKAIGPANERPERVGLVVARSAFSVGAKITDAEMAQYFQLQPRRVSSFDVDKRSEVSIYEKMDKLLAEPQRSGPLHHKPLAPADVAALRAEVARWLLPEIPERESLALRYRLFGVQRERPVIVVNLQTGKPETEIHRDEAFQASLALIKATMGDWVNIAVVGGEGIKAEPNVALVPPDALKDGSVDALMADRKTIAVISADTGLSHVAAALRQDRPNTVHTLFTELGAQYNSPERWGIPSQVSRLLTPAKAARCRAALEAMR